MVTRIRDLGDGALHIGICNAQGASAGTKGRGPRENIGVGCGPSGEGQGPFGTQPIGVDGTEAKGILISMKGLLVMGEKIQV